MGFVQRSFHAQLSPLNHALLRAVRARETGRLIYSYNALRAKADSFRRGVTGAPLHVIFTALDIASLHESHDDARTKSKSNR